MALFLFSGATCHATRAATCSPNFECNQAFEAINTPTADILGHDHIRMSMASNSGAFSMGLFDYFEMGLLAYKSTDDSYFGNRLTIKLFPEADLWPALAVGGESVTGNPNFSSSPTVNSHYLVMSKDLGAFGKVHIGSGDGRFTGNGDTASAVHGVFAGIERLFLEGSPFEVDVKLEEDGRDINAGIEKRLLPDLSMTLTAIEIDNVMVNHPANRDSATFVGFVFDEVLPGEAVQ